MKVTAKTRRSGGWWAIEVPEVPGAFTQAKRLDQVAEAAALAVVDLLELGDEESVEVALDVDLEASVREYVDAAREAAEVATAAREKASTAMREAVAVLREDEQLTTRDAAALLGVTHQRIAQLGSAGASGEQVHNVPAKVSDIGQAYGKTRNVRARKSAQRVTKSAAAATKRAAAAKPAAARAAASLRSGSSSVKSRGK